MAILHCNVLVILAALCVTGLAFTTVEDCPTFNGDGEDVTVKLCEDTCYYFHRKEALTFKDASGVCRGRGGTLAMPRSDGINEFLQEELAPEDKDSQDAQPAKKFWIGMLEQISYMKGTAFFWLNGEKVSAKYAESVLKYGDAYTIYRKLGIWQFQKSDVNVKNYFVCEMKEYNNPNATLAPATTITTTMMTTATTTTATTTITLGVTSQPPKSDNVCPKITKDASHMKVFEKFCFYFSIQDVKTYAGADKFCRSHHGTLALVKSKEIDGFLRKSLKEFSQDTEVTAWIGLHSDDLNLPVTWDDGNPTRYVNYRYSFPIWTHYTMSAIDKWEAYPSVSSYSFICQFHANL